MAVVISLDPFIITSEESDMRWQTTVKEEDFEVVGLVEKQVLENCKKKRERVDIYNKKSKI